MTRSLGLTIAYLASLALLGCGDDDGGAATATSNTSGAGGSAGGGGAGATGGAAGGAGASGGVGAGGSAAGGGGGGGGGPTCTAALEQALSPIDAVSDGVVTTLDQSGGATTLFVDATAGGFMSAAENPWIYIELEGGDKVSLTDPAALADDTWDLALKRALLRTNSGVSGPAGGGAVLLDGEAFDGVTAARAQAAMIEVEQWFDADCNLFTDATGAIATTFDGWYDYTDMVLTPHPGTWVVRAADGDLFKLEILDYYANPDGTTGGTTSARYRLRYAAL